MSATVGVKTLTGDKIYRNVHYVSMRDGFLTIRYRQDGADKTARIESEYVISFVIG